MAIRFSHRELWDRDWFLNMEGKFQLFVLYLRDHCDHAGVWQVGFKRFEETSKFRIFQQEFLNAVNNDSKRIIVLENGRWWITGFIEDQYRTMILNEMNKAHKGILNSIRFNNVPFESIGYKIAPTKPLQGAKEQEQEKDIGIKPLGIDSLNLEDDKKPKTWRTSFAIYQASASKALETLREDREWLTEREKYHPGLNLELTLEKAFGDYWFQPAGWKNKKSKKIVDIDWKATANNALSQKCNQVWKNDKPNGRPKAGFESPKELKKYDNL